MSRVIDTLRTLQRYGEYILSTVGAIVFVAYLIEPIRHQLETAHLIDNQAILALFGLACTLAIASVSELRRLILDTSAGTTSQIIPDGITSVYEHLDPVLRRGRGISVVPQRRRRVDVIGLTLFSAWPHLCGILENRSNSSWLVTVQCMDPDFADHSLGVSDSWKKTLRAQIYNIETYLEQSDQSLKERDIEVKLVKYCFLPALHGFRIDERDLFISFCQWNDRLHLRDPYQFYEHFAADDHSQRATEYRQLFDNWFTAGVKSSET
jgi:hypothetical protein